MLHYDSRMLTQFAADAARLRAAPSRAADSALTREAERLWPALAPLKSAYPGFGMWYWDKVVPGLLRGTRHLFRIGGTASPSAVAIAKREAGEAKICTVWVAEAERARGHGRLLLEETIEWLGVDHPLFTVPAERYLEFEPLMRRFSFVETARVESLYRRGVVEHVFNGTPGPITYT